jgi:hypothetical protein
MKRLGFFPVIRARVASALRPGGLLIYLATAGEEAFAIGPYRWRTFGRIPSKLP